MFFPRLNSLNATTCLGGILLLAMGFAQSARADTDDVYWNKLTGAWGTLTNWEDENQIALSAFPTSGTGDYFLINGLSGATAETTMPGATANRNIASLTVGQYNTLIFTGISPTGSAGNPRISGNWVNSGTTRAGTAATDSIRMEINWIASANTTNTGTIEATQGRLHLNMANGSLINTGGLLLAKSGTIFNLQGSAAGSIQNGTLRSESGSVLEVGGAAGVALNTTLTGVTVDNQGTFQALQSTVNYTGSRIITTTVSGASLFKNSGLTLIQNTGGGHSAGQVSPVVAASTQHSVQFLVSGTTTYQNLGTLRILNDTTRTSATTGAFVQNAIFSITSANATFTSTGTIEVFHDSLLANTTSQFTSVKSIVNEGLVHIRGNTNNAGASLTISGAGNSYTQSAAGDRTLLERGGVISAATLLIQAGDFGGTGTVTGNTTIGSAATLIAADTLAAGPGAGELLFNGNLTLENDSEVRFALGADPANRGRISLSGAFNLTLGAGVTITITDLGSLEAGTYRLFDLGTGTITGTNFVLNALPSGWSGTLLGGAGTDYLDLQISAIPEPSAALLLGVGGALFALSRRLRSRA